MFLILDYLFLMDSHWFLRVTLTKAASMGRNLERKRCREAKMQLSMAESLLALGEDCLSFLSR